MSDKITMVQFLKNLSNENHDDRFYPENNILNQKCVFQEFWNRYKQIYNFNVEYNKIKGDLGSHFNGLRGMEFFESLKVLPYNTLILNCKYNDYMDLKRFFRERYDKSKRIFSNCEEDLILVSYFLFENKIYLFISPTDYEGNIKSNAFVLKIGMFEKIYKRIEKFSDNKNLHNLYGHIARNVIRHLYYLSKCNTIELPNDIKYIVSENNEKIFNIVTDNMEIKSVREKDFGVSYNIIDGVLYYNKSVRESTGKTLSSHTRRGHQHRYWVGSGDKKRLVTKWVKPIIVNEGKNELSTVINNIN